MWSRRELLKNAAAGFGVLLVPPGLLRGQGARAAGTDPVLVAVFLRGGADFLNLVVPAGDPYYYSARPTLAVGAGSELPLDGFFGLHPNLAALRPWYQSGQLAAVHACGSPNGTRSHFDEQDFLERAVPGDRSVRTGWLNRYLAAAGLSDPIAGISMGNSAVKALEGTSVSLAIPSIVSLNIGSNFPVDRAAALDQIYAVAGGPWTRTAENAFDVYDTIRGISTTTSVTYPSNSLGTNLKDVAALIKANIGVRVAAADLGGWDHHTDEISRLPGLASGLAAALNAFATDLGADLNRTAVVVMTEFGRRAAQNGSLGADHGLAAAMLVLGGGVSGGQVLLRDGVWPGLAPAQMSEGLDLRATTDFRDVFAELLQRHMGLTNLTGMFPGYSPTPAQYPGLFA